MGRYAFFSTGVERKFTFGVQDSFEMRKFAGVITTTAEGFTNDTHSHTWSASRDKGYILTYLQNLIKDTDLKLPDYTLFASSVEGTYALRRSLEEQASVYYSLLGDTYFTFELGCMIYHQLLYEPELSVRYEVGCV